MTQPEADRTKVVRGVNTPGKRGGRTAAKENEEEVRIT